MTEITCRRCNGGGTEELAASYGRVLAVLRDAEFAWVTTSAIQRHSLVKKVSHAMLCKRLSLLKTFGLVESRKSATDPRALEWRHL